MVYYPIATLMAAGIRKILIITTPEYQASFTQLLGSGEQFGVEFHYQAQITPGGLAQAFLIGEKFIDGNKCALILGDNIFHGSGLGRQLMDYTDLSGAHIFAYRVSNPKEYGVVEFNKSGEVVSIEEKPDNPKSNFAVPGLYFYDQDVVEIAKGIKPSSRGELEITSINNEYLKLNSLKVSILPRGTAWLDTGTVQTLHDASTYIRILEERQGTKVSCLEEVAWRQGWITDEELSELVHAFGHSPYGTFLASLLATDGEREL
jgi:glucose-1-phosphate thymidylyltransferase